MDAAESPVIGEADEAHLTDDIGIALSGGGFRAMLFHAGAIVRLFETGLLQQAARISSVSGGSILSAKLALEWPRLADRDALFEHVIDPLRALARAHVDVPSVLIGKLLTGNVGTRIAGAYARHLFGDATLQDLPETPVFVINATNVETGTLWRFTRKRARDWRVGEISAPTFRLADVVAASSAFPPVLSPFSLKVRPEDFSIVEQGVDPAFLRDIALTDGGVYDNLGLETVFKRCRTLLVSNGGGALPWQAAPAFNWLFHTRRVIEIIHSQVASVRTRQLLETFRNGERHGTYWGIGTAIADYQLPDALPAPLAKTRQLAETPTRLSKIDDLRQQQLINWGYAVCDAGLRRYVPAGRPYAPPAFPYPDAAI